MRENPATVYSDSLYSISSFAEEYATICFTVKDGKGKEGRLSKRDMEILLKWLTRDCGVIVTSGDVRPISFIHPHTHTHIFLISRHHRES